MSFYGVLNSIWRRERQSKDLIDLEEDFFKKTRAYLNHLENQISDEKNDELVKELFAKRFEHARYLVNDLIDLRINKHIQETLSDDFIDIQERKLPDEEREFRSRLDKLTNQFKDTVHGKNEFNQKSTSKFLLVEMSKAENRVLTGPEMEYYGPFKPNDVVFLPVNLANIMIDQSKAESLD